MDLQQTPLMVGQDVALDVTNGRLEGCRVQLAPWAHAATVVVVVVLSWLARLALPQQAKRFMWCCAAGQALVFT